MQQTPQDKYSSVNTYENLIELNIQFIEGGIDWTPFHQKPLPDLGENFDKLIKINRLNFLTLGGQCAVDTPTLERKLFFDGYLKPELVRNLTKYLKQFKKIEYFIQLPSLEIKTNIRNWHLQPANVYFTSLFRTRPNPDTEWTNRLILPFQDLGFITENVWKGYPKAIDILKNYAFVHIQHRSFHNVNNDLYDIMLGYLEQQKGKLNFGKSQIILKRLKNDLSKINQI